MQRKLFCWVASGGGAERQSSQSGFSSKKVRPKLSTTHRLEFKNVFGAAGGYINGRIFISCGKFGVALRLPPSTLGMLFQEKEVKHLKYFPKGHTKKEYAVLSKRILKSKLLLKNLVDKSIKYVLSLKGRKY